MNKRTKDIDNSKALLNKPKEERKKEFGRRLWNLLLTKNWNQSDLARKSGLTRDSISVYVRGRSMPTGKSLSLLAKAFGMSVEELCPWSVSEERSHDSPTVELRQVTDDNSKAWLKVNRTVSFEVASKIIELLNEHDKQNSGK